mgnify:CR=1 FL=1
MKIDFVEALAEISKDDWNKIHLNEYPFLKYDFLKSLEDTKCVASNKGWTPLHITVKDKNQNTFETKKFNYQLDKEFILVNDAIIHDFENNKFKIETALVDLKSSSLKGEKIKIN